MPELPDITVYLEAIESRALGQRLDRLLLVSPFLLRSILPKPSEFEGAKLAGTRRVGKRIALGFDNGCWAVLHLMIAGRLHWETRFRKPNQRRDLAFFHFDNGWLRLTEAGAKRRASLHVVQGEEGLRALDPGGADIFAITPAEFHRALTAENHTLKRSLTDPHIFSGIGNAYSDEILHRAQMSPVQLTAKLSEADTARLFAAARETMLDWTERLRKLYAGQFPEKVTAFRDDMAVHGRFGKPCPRCATPVQRIRYADNETNYCPACQTGGKLLADRGLSRLLKSDWPRSLDEMEDRITRATGAAPHLPADP